MVKFSTSFIAAGGNRHPSAADWDATTSRLAFGAGRNIGIWKPLEDSYHGITSLLSGHNDVVNAVKFITCGTDGFTILLSGAADGFVGVWILDDNSLTGYRNVSMLKDHQKAITTIAVLPEASVFVSGASDGDIRIWRIQSSHDHASVDVECICQHNLSPKYFPLALAVARLQTCGSTVLAVAGSKSFIQIFVVEETKLRVVATLTGHEAWIRSLDFVEESADDAHSDLLLASASQDKYIRLWRIHQGDALSTTSAAQDPLLGSLGKSLSNKAHRFDTKDGKFRYSATFEALLLGHEDWIFTAQWKRVDGTIKLLTASADNSLAIWEVDPQSGVWFCTVRLGEMSSQKGATTATGSTGGFWIGLWSPDGNAVVSLGRTGSWRLWRHDATNDMWEQDVAVGGHTKEVRALAWSKDGSYLLSTSADQTTRLYAQWKTAGSISWHELSRPQIHGYDLNCLDTIGISQFISGADEKLLRVFDMPKGVAELLESVCEIHIETTQPLLDAANIPVLGLSNKAIDTAGNQDDYNDDAETIPPENEKFQFSTTSGITANISMNKPPTEDSLSRSLLWPETEKLYGHGYEISAVAVNHSGAVIATACRASSLEHAVIRLYDTATWRQLEPPLAAHTLTVTALEFSEDDQYLLSVGRDRQCAVFLRGDDQKSITYTLVATDPKTHSRMLLDAAWAPRAAGYFFATAGRDKNVHIWQLGTDHQFERKASINAIAPVTAVAFLQRLARGKVVLSYGLEDGSVHLARFDLQAMEANIQSESLPAGLAPSLAVTRLTWRPHKSDVSSVVVVGETSDRSSISELAVASEDGSLRIFEIDLA